MEHTREEFFLEAQKLGLTPQMVVSIMRRNGIKGKYEVEKHEQYMKLLVDYTMCLKRLMNTVNKIEDKSHPLEKCPVCGAPVERDSKLDRLYGCQLGWKCLNPEQGKPSHFFEYQLERIKPWMQRNLGTSEQEQSSETMLLTEYPSGVDLAEISSVDYLG